ncbi:MAG: HAD-IA family hydrolase [Microbacterium sp.]|uniref:HAD-IA family hydrolase n=1 Tax=Microbacterium sp. TaxID=51671 RepID=UPI001AD41C8A|nr:HAD-IA family hydrolase [Microbacterium sp.]MBN9177411.1 HAD-IA family hydrolase [Microbacterium sp.]
MTSTFSSRPLVRRSSEELGIPTAALLALADRLAEDGLDPHALLVARRGEVAFETAWAPYRQDRPALVYSASKTFTSLAIGFLADEGRVSLDAAAADLLAVVPPTGAPVITVRHLLTMNTGHTSAQIDALGEDPRELLHVTPEREPGTHFAYSSPATHALSAIVTALTGEALTAYLRPRLLDPLGIGERWMRSRGGVEHGASGYHLTVEDLARVAIMLGAGGAFAGAQVAPAWYVEEMSRPWSVTASFDGPAAAAGEANDWALGYGYQVWRSTHGFRLDGAAGQFGLVIPEHDLVLAYQGATADTQATLRAFWAFVDAVAVAEAAGGAGSPAAGAAGAALPAPSEARDTWDARDRIALWPGEAPSAEEGLTLVDTGDGWSLTLPDVGELPVATRWTEILFRKQAEPAASAATGVGGDDSACVRNGEADRLHLATRGETRPDGSVLVHVVDTTSPHRMIVTRDAAGAVTAGWHVPPLANGWEGLQVPASVAEARGTTTTDAAALLLDMDGTLVDSTAVVERLWTQWSIEHGVDPARTLAIIHGRQGQDSMALLLPDRPHEINLAENRELLVAETAQTEGVVAIPGAAALLGALEGLPHALVTSATRELAQARMDAAGLAMPPLAVTAEDVARSKPDPEGFVAAARALGVEPAACIVVEDSANGIAAGLAAGMRVIGVGPHAAAAGPTWAVADATGIQVSPIPDGAGVRVSIAG